MRFVFMRFVSCFMRIRFMRIRFMRIRFMGYPLTWPIVFRSWVSQSSSAEIANLAGFQSGGKFYYSRYLVHWDIRESMTEADVEIVL